MYCKTCGNLNREGSNYCAHDGEVLAPPNTPKLRLVKSSSSFCGNCGSRFIDGQNYCGNCGNTILKYEASGDITKEPSAVIEKIVASPKNLRLPQFKLSYLKAALIPAIIAFVIMLTLQVGVYQLTKGTMQKVTGELFNEDLLSIVDDTMSYAGDEGIRLPKPDKLYGFSDMVMTSNLVAPTFNLQMDGNIDGEKGSIEGKYHFSLLFILYALIPILSLFIGGILAGHNREEGIGRKIYKALGIGLIYGVILAIFSMFSGFNYDVNVAQEDFKINLDLHTSYSLFKSLFVGITIGSISAFIGMLFAINYRHATKNLIDRVPFGDAIHQAFATFSRIFILCAVMIGATALFFISKLKNEVGFLFDLLPLGELIEKAHLMIVLMGTQLCALFFNLAHFGSFQMIAGANNKEQVASFSLLFGYDTNGGADISELFGLELPAYFKLLLIVPILLFLWSGYQMAKSKNISFITLGIYSLVYALIVSLMTYFSQFYTQFEVNNMLGSDKMNAETFLGFGVFGMFIRSFLLAYLFSFIGSYIRKFRNA